jgi:hypothetical protein
MIDSAIGGAFAALGLLLVLVVVVLVIVDEIADRRRVRRLRRPANPAPLLGCDYCPARGTLIVATSTTAGVVRLSRCCPDCARRVNGWTMSA